MQGGKYSKDQGDGVSEHYVSATVLYRKGRESYCFVPLSDSLVQSGLRNARGPGRTTDRLLRLALLSGDAGTH